MASQGDPEHDIKSESITTYTLKQPQNQNKQKEIDPTNFEQRKGTSSYQRSGCQNKTKVLGKTLNRVFCRCPVDS